MLASHVILVRPTGFDANIETAVSNVFQGDSLSSKDRERAEREHSELAHALSQHGIEVLVLEPHRPDLPDAVFPNNWFSTDPSGYLDIYPMQARSRQREVRPDMVEELRKHGYKVTSLRDWREQAGDAALEGTGSLVLDPASDLVYAARSSRTDERLLRDWSAAHERELLVFDALDEQGLAIYHTNVVMGVGEQLAIACLDCVADEADRDRLRSQLTERGRELIEISYFQLRQFAGNVMFLAGKGGETLFMSRRGWESLAEGQRQRINERVLAVPVAVDTLESTGGGSVRCMIAENFLPREFT